MVGLAFSFMSHLQERNSEPYATIALPHLPAQTSFSSVVVIPWLSSSLSTGLRLSRSSKSGRRTGSIGRAPMANALVAMTSLSFSSILGGSFGGVSSAALAVSLGSLGMPMPYRRARSSRSLLVIFLANWSGFFSARRCNSFANLSPSCCLAFPAAFSSGTNKRGGMPFYKMEYGFVPRPSRKVRFEVASPSPTRSEPVEPAPSVPAIPAPPPRPAPVPEPDDEPEDPFEGVSDEELLAALAALEPEEPDKPGRFSWLGAGFRTGLRYVGGCVVSVVTPMAVKFILEKATGGVRLTQPLVLPPLPPPVARQASVPGHFAGAPQHCSGQLGLLGQLVQLS